MSKDWVFSILRGVPWVFLESSDRLCEDPVVSSAVQVVLLAVQVVLLAVQVLVLLVVEVVLLEGLCTPHHHPLFLGVRLPW